MSDIYKVYSFIVKCAAPSDRPASGFRASVRHYIIDPLTRTTDDNGNTIGILGRTGRAFSGSSSRLGRLRERVYSAFDPFASPEERHSSFGYALGHEIGDFVLPKMYDPTDLGPYEEYSAYLKETERGDMLLREASKLRRRARLLKKLRKQEEKEKEYASRSRYF